jgi:hypothetical protein
MTEHIRYLIIEFTQDVDTVGALVVQSAARGAGMGGVKSVTAGQCNDEGLIVSVDIPVYELNPTRR